MKTRFVCVTMVCLVFAEGVSAAGILGGKKKQANFALVPESDLRAVAHEIEREVAAGNRQAVRPTGRGFRRDGPGGRRTVSARGV